MHFGGALFDPNPRAERPLSLGGMLSSAGVLLGGFTIVAGMFLPWTHQVYVGPAYRPPNGFAAGGVAGWLLAAIGFILFFGALANMLSHSRPFNLGLQLFAVAGGVAALALHAFAKPCSSSIFSGNARSSSEIHHMLGMGPSCPWQGTGLGDGYYITRTGVGIAIASAVIALTISGLATVFQRRRRPRVA